MRYSYLINMFVIIVIQIIFKTSYKVSVDVVLLSSVIIGFCYVIKAIEKKGE